MGVLFGTDPDPMIKLILGPLRCLPEDTELDEGMLDRNQLLHVFALLGTELLPGVLSDYRYILHGGPEQNQERKAQAVRWIETLVEGRRRVFHAE